MTCFVAGTVLDILGWAHRGLGPMTLMAQSVQGTLWDHAGGDKTWQEVFEA